MSTNPNNAVGTNGAYGGRTSVEALNDALGGLTRGVLSGWACAPNSGLTVSLGGNGSTRDVAIAQDNAGNKTTINNISGSPVDVTLSAAPGSNSRIDAIVAYVDNPPAGTSTSVDNPAACGIIAVAGTASSSPVVPNDSTIRSAITSDGASGATAFYVVLATVTVNHGATDITSGDITVGNSAQIGGTQIADGSVTSDKIDFTTSTATAYSTTTTALTSTAVTLCTLTIPSDGNYIIDGEVRVNSTGGDSVTRNCWSQFTTDGTGTFAHSLEEGVALNARSGAVGGIATVPVKNILNNAKAGDKVNLRSRTNATPSDVSAYLGIMSAIKVG